MKLWILSEDLVTELEVAAIAVGAVMSFAILGFVLTFVVAPI
jgi:hypothetical protein